MNTSTGAGKVAIITGCASGIGLATTQLLLSNQYKVFGVDISDMDLTKVESNDQDRFHFHHADLLKEGECDEVVKACISKFGDKIDVLANVAGIMDAFEAADTLVDSQWDKIIAINLTIPTKLIRAVLPSMKANKSGSIINVSSKAGLTGAAAGVAYTASKHGILGVTKNTAWRFRAEGIRCNAVLPGGVGTNISSSMNMASFDQESYAQVSPVIALHVPDMKPHVSPNDVANTIAFLASDQASSINGISLPVDQAWNTI